MKRKNNYDSILDKTNLKIGRKLLENQLKDKIIVNNLENLINTKLDKKTGNFELTKLFR